MERMTPQEIRDLMDAVIADPNAKLQSVIIFHESAPWGDIDAAIFNFGAFRYRIKPKLLDLWANIYRDGDFAAYPSEAAARNGITIGASEIAVRYVRADK